MSWRRFGFAFVLAISPIALRAQTPPPTPLNWDSDDSARVAFATTRGRAYRSGQVIVWAPPESLAARWLDAFVDSLATGIDAMRRLMGGPYPWQRIGERPITYYLSPGRFVSHASGAGAVFISLTRVRSGGAPYLHEAAHELLAPPAPFSPFEYTDSVTAERAAARFPQWLNEGLPDYLAQATASATGFHEGDVFEVGGLAKVDSTCAARLAQSPRRAEILEKVGRSGRLEALFRTDRAQVAPVFYACSQSFTKYVVDRAGIRAVIAAFPGIPSGTWVTDLDSAAGTSLETLRHAWIEALAALPQAYPHATEPIGTVRQIYDGALTPDLAVNTFRNIDRLFPTRAVTHATRPRALPRAARPLGDVRFTDRGKRYDLGAYLALNRVTGLLVLKDGRIALERYRLGNTERTHWMSMSVAKSITSTLIGAAIKEHYIASLADSVTHYVPALAGSAYDGVTVRDVLMMASGARWNETYTDPASDRRRLLEAQIGQVPGSAMAVMRSLPRAAPPGTVNNYSTGETQVAAEILRRAVGRPLATYLSERIWSRFGMETDASWWLDSPDGVEIGGSGISATLRDYGRFGLFLLGGGVAGGDSILPIGWIAEATSPKTLRDGTPLDYGYLWWPGRGGAYAAEGIYGQWIYVNPAAQVVIVVWSAQAKPTGAAVVDDGAFFDAVVSALQ